MKKRRACVGAENYRTQPLNEVIEDAIGIKRLPKGRHKAAGALFMFVGGTAPT